MKKEILLGLLFFSLLVTPTLAVQRGGPGNANGEYFTGSMEVVTVTIGGSIELSGANSAINGPKFKVTSEGGYAVKLTNRTGSTVSKGMVVRNSRTYDNAFEFCSASSIDAIGVVYDNSAADGSDSWVVFAGIADVMIKDGTASTRGYFLYSSDTTGRAFANQPEPPNTTAHWQEMGHCLESKSSGTNVLAKCILHFN
ncbi:MAG: capsid cement protein [Syntrophales bacterium]